MSRKSLISNIKVIINLMYSWRFFIFFLLPFGLLSQSGCSQDAEDGYEKRNGDIYFQSLPYSALVYAIEGATHSPYSHCGVLSQEEGHWYIWEAIGPVRRTLLDDWINQGRGGNYSVFRVDADYEEGIPDLLSAVKGYQGRPYDILYSFDDEKIYCSELIFKAFNTVYSEELGDVTALGDLNWEPYEAIIRAIDPSLPLKRKIITPRALSEASQLAEIYSSFD